tara:strand:+ start:2146 stop:2331 length:186 start_codon:yes stop_codon:yes gene_type:complete
MKKYKVSYTLPFKPTGVKQTEEYTTEAEGIEQVIEKLKITFTKFYGLRTIKLKKLNIEEIE